MIFLSLNKNCSLFHLSWRRKYHLILYVFFRQYFSIFFFFPSFFFFKISIIFCDLYLSKKVYIKKPWSAQFVGLGQYKLQKYIYPCFRCKTKPRKQVSVLPLVCAFHSEKYILILYIMRPMSTLINVFLVLLINVFLLLQFAKVCLPMKSIYIVKILPKYFPYSAVTQLYVLNLYVKWPI
jgi:hypothetical protein